VTTKEADDPKEEEEGTPTKIERKATMVAKAPAQAKSSPKGE